MSAIQNFAFEEHLVRVVEQNGEPWFVGKDVCVALGIKNHNDALSDLDEDEKGVAITDPLSTYTRGGGAQEAVIVSEPGVYRLVFRSRKPEAERFKRWLAHEVLPQIRRTGRYDPAAQRPEPPALFEIDIQHAPLSAKTDYLRLVARLRGREAAVAMMPHIGLPDIDLIMAGVHIAPDGEQCLAHILGWRDDRGMTVRDMVTEALHRGEAITRHLRPLGIRAVPDGEPGMAIATNPRCTALIFQQTKWDKGGHVASLRGLPGVSQMRTMKFDAIASGALFVPAHLLQLAGIQQVGEE